MNTTFKSGLIALIDQLDIELWKEKKEFLGMIHTVSYDYYHFFLKYFSIRFNGGSTAAKFCHYDTWSNDIYFIHIFRSNSQGSPNH